MNGLDILETPLDFQRKNEKISISWKKVLDMQNRAALAQYRLFATEKKELPVYFKEQDVDEKRYLK